jgi:hypothetical protein
LNRTVPVLVVLAKMTCIVMATVIAGVGPGRRNDDFDWKHGTVKTKSKHGGIGVKSETICVSGGPAVQTPPLSSASKLNRDGMAALEMTSHKKKEDRVGRQTFLPTDGPPLYPKTRQTCFRAHTRRPSLSVLAVVTRR